MSSILGWGYFLIWSLSFYPQVWINYKFESCEGLSIEYALLNPSGYLFYTIYSLQGTVDEEIGDTGEIETNDLIFAVHGFFLSSFIFSQALIYPRGKLQSKISWWVIILLVLEWLLVLILFGIEIYDPTLISQSWSTIRMCGYAKALITLVKYMPQVYLNYKRKSTVGWSLANVFMDLTGGVLSFMQIVVD